MTRALTTVTVTARARAQVAERNAEEATTRAQQYGTQVQEAEERVQQLQEDVEQANQRAQTAEAQMQAVATTLCNTRDEHETALQNIQVEYEGNLQNVREELERRRQEVEQQSRQFQTRAHEAEQRSQQLMTRTHEAEERSRQYQTRAHRAEERMRQSEIQAHEAEESIQHAEERSWGCELRVQTAEESLQRLQQVVDDATERRQLSEQRAREAEERLQEIDSQWVVQRNEIQLTDEELGRGSWAAVKVAVFRGTRVAAKCFFQQIVSQYNRRLFRREMNMASRIRHPNLIQFIGATLQGEMIILTQLMPTSLRAVLEERAILVNEITSISLDVARALNYLHLMRPDPIVHRDISSANVLLEPAPNNSWKAKVSDYGSVNQLQSLRTEGPGNPTYAAPEANTPEQQTPKMDIFSFGVLLIEMCTDEFPETNEVNREGQIRSIQYASFMALIRQCLEVNKDNRPSASDLVIELSR